MKNCIRCNRLKKPKKFSENSHVCIFCENKHRQKLFSQRFNLTKPLSKGSERRKNIKTNGGYYTKSEWSALKKKYRYRCLRCLKQEPEIRLQADHIIPVKRGGPSWISNIQPMCGRCNGEKGTKIIDYRGVVFEDELDTDDSNLVN